MKKTLAIVSLIIVALVGVNELGWIGKSDLAWPLIGLSVAIGLVSVSQLVKE